MASSEKPCQRSLPLRYISFGFSDFSSNSGSADESGQTVVEFSLVFVLLVIVAWIPADFGLAVYTGQIALNASREAARIAASDRNLTVGSCTMPNDCLNSTNSALKAAGLRLNSAILHNATISVALEGSGCNQEVKISIIGFYQYFFYNVLQFMGFDITNPVQITRETRTRWEHQC